MKFIKYTTFAVLLFGLGIAQSSVAAGVSFGKPEIRSIDATVCKNQGLTNCQVIIANVYVNIPKPTNASPDPVQILDIKSLYNTTTNQVNPGDAKVYRIENSLFNKTSFETWEQDWFTDSGFTNDTIHYGDIESKGGTSVYKRVSQLVGTKDNPGVFKVGKSYSVYFYDEKSKTKSESLQFTVGSDYKISTTPAILKPTTAVTQTVAATKDITAVSVKNNTSSSVTGGGSTSSTVTGGGTTSSSVTGGGKTDNSNSKIGGSTATNSGANPPSILKLKNPLKSDLNTIPKIVNALLDKIVIPIAVPIFILAIIYTGILYVIARGKPEKITEAHNALKWTLIGGAVILGAKLISSAIAGTLAAITNTIK